MKHNKVNTILFFQNAYEDMSWSCLPLHSSSGFDSIQEMVEVIADSFKKAIDARYEEYSGNCWHCCMDRRKGLSVCVKCGEDTKTPEVTRDDVEKIMDEIFDGTMQDFAGGYDGANDFMNIYGIESFGISGNAGQTVTIGYGPELIVKTIFDGFDVDNTEVIYKCSSVRLYKDKDDE